MLAFQQRFLTWLHWMAETWFSERLQNKPTPVIVAQPRKIKKWKEQDMLRRHTIDRLVSTLGKIHSSAHPSNTKTFYIMSPCTLRTVWRNWRRAGVWTVPPASCNVKTRPSACISVLSCLYFFFGYIHFHAGPCCRPRKYRLIVDLNSTDKKLATKQDRQTLQNFDEKQNCHSYIA